MLSEVRIIGILRGLGTGRGPEGDFWGAGNAVFDLSASYISVFSL